MDIMILRSAIRLIYSFQYFAINALFFFSSRRSPAMTGSMSAISIIQPGGLISVIFLNLLVISSLNFCRWLVQLAITSRLGAISAKLQKKANLFFYRCIFQRLNLFKKERTFSAQSTRLVFRPCRVLFSWLTCLNKSAMRLWKLY